MTFPLYVPRLNNNDDTVRLNGFLVQVGTQVRPGDSVADIETDKASFMIEAEREGYVLALQGKPGDVLDVGSVLVWLGESATEPVPAQLQKPSVPRNGPGAVAEPTLKASILLAQFNLEPDSIPASGERLTVQDVESYVASRGLKPAQVYGRPARSPLHAPTVPGRREKLSPEDRGMLRTVLWHRDEAVPGYVELQYDPATFEQYAAEFQKRHKLLFSPLLALHAWRLAQAASRQPKLNSTLVDGERHQYDSVNLGFTVQSGDALFVVVVEDAGQLGEKDLVHRLGELQRAAMKRALKASESSGCTVTFTSMARWGVARHMPVLPPHTALIVAHSAPVGGAAYIGATYDHRVLSGFDAVQALQAVINTKTET